MLSNTCFLRAALSSSSAVVFASLATCLVAFVAFLFRFFPTAAGHLGGDYEYFLPLLLAGKYWIAQNGALAPPIFTPAFCGGVPLLANPQSIFYSLPQLLSLLVDPVRAFLLTTIIFALLGAGSTYLLLSRSFQASTAASLLGAVLFLFNGFLLHRMMSGQVPYHVVGLVPVAAYVLLLDRRSGTGALAAAIGPVAATGFIVGYVIYAGAVNIIVPFGLAVLLVWCLHALVVAPMHSFWPWGILGGLLGIALGAMKLAPAIAFVSAFPRPDPLALMGFTALVAGLFYGFLLPFVAPPALRPEFDFGVGPVPFFIVSLLLLIRARRLRLAQRLRETGPSLKLTLSLCILLLIPIVINYDGPGFRPFLQKLPYIGNNVILIRWWFAYIPFVILLSAVLFDRVVASRRHRNIVASCGMLVTAIYSVAVDHSYYERQPYDPAEITQADARLRRSDSVPPISAIGDEKNGLSSGISRFPCYEPMFGYYLQTFPAVLQRGSLASGASLLNPACYIYGAANGCKPGDAFTPGSDAQAAFGAYRPFSYVIPLWQIGADAITLVALGLVGAGLLFGLWRAAFRRWRPA